MFIGIFIISVSIYYIFLFMEKQIEKRLYTFTTPVGSAEDKFMGAFMQYTQEKMAEKENHRGVFAKMLDKFLKDSRPIIQKVNIEEKMKNDGYLCVLKDAAERYAVDRDSKEIILKVILKAEEDIRAKKENL